MTGLLLLNAAATLVAAFAARVAGGDARTRLFAALCGGLLALGRELELLRFECSPLRGVLTKQRLDVDHTRRRSRVAIGVDPLPRFLRPEASIPATPRGGEVDPREQ